MATKKAPLAKAGADRGVLAANVYVHDGGPDGEAMWFGPSYPQNGQPSDDIAASLPAHVWDARKVWPTPDDAARVGLEYGPPDARRATADDDEPAAAAAGGA